MQIKATQKSKLLPQVGRSIILGEDKIALFLLSDGSIVAIEDHCPLTGGPVLEGIVSDHFLYEPMREYKISLRTGDIQPPDEGHMRIYPVTIIDDDVYIEVGG